MPRLLKKDPWAEASAHLQSVDPRWIKRIAKHGPCPLRPRRERFAILVRAIIGQQISSKAATSIDARLRERTGTPHQPGPLLELGESGLREVGLSGVKARYVLNLSEAVASGELPLHRIGHWDDERIIEHLTAIKGIGRWTAEMFLIFALNRPDVLPVGDLGIRNGFRLHFELEERPKPEECRVLAEPWRPYRTLAMWYLWRSLDDTR